MRINRLPAACMIMSVAALALVPASAVPKPRSRAHSRPVHAPARKAAARTASAPKTTAPNPLTPAQLARLVMPSVVRITVMDANGKPKVWGSGFVVAPNLIVTNVHVIRGAHSAVADFTNGRTETVYGVVTVDNDRDLVLLYANTNGIRALPLMTEGTVQVGDPVIAVGSPEGLGGSMSTGIISQITREGGTKMLMTTAPISHGSSGGALVDMYGRVLGVTSMSLEGGQNLNFAYAAYYVQQLLPRSLPVYMSWSDEEAYTENHRVQTADAPAAKPPPATASQSTPATKPPPYNNADVSALIDDIFQSQGQIDACNTDIVNTTTDESNIQAQITTLEQDAFEQDQRQRDVYARAEANLDRSQIETLKAKLRPIEDKLASLRDKVKTLQTALDAKNQTLRELPPPPGQKASAR